MRQQSIVKKLVLLVPLFVLGGSTLVMGQVQAAATSSSGLNFFASFGGLRTHVINYTYNALGVNGGIYAQRSPRFGVEVRGGTYPMYARYSQSPITAGYRTEFAGPRWHTWLFSGYFGGGMSLAQDAGPHVRAHACALVAVLASKPGISDQSRTVEVVALRGNMDRNLCSAANP